MIDRIKDWYHELPSDKRSKVKMFSILGAIAAVFYLLVQMGSANEAEEVAAKGPTMTTVGLTENLLEDSLSEGVKSSLNDQDTKIDDLGAAFKEEKQTNAERFKRLEELIIAGNNIKLEAQDTITEDDLKPTNEYDQLKLNQFPPSPTVKSDVIASPYVDAGGQPIARVVKGGIGGLKPQPRPISEKKSKETIYLPVGFMRAVLLTGVDAPVGGEAQSNPEPVLARIQAPAVLPNHVKANLQGCFIIGNAVGNLSKERVMVRSVSLTCLDYDQRRVIDTPIKGYFADTDGKIGLSGKVVTRDGALVGRAFIAGLFEGFGQVASVGAGTQTVSPLGATTVFDTGEAARAGLGQGISQSSETLSEYYLDLAKTVTPIIEVGASKEVVFVVQEGIDIQIKEVGDE